VQKASRSREVDRKVVAELRSIVGREGVLTARSELLSYDADGLTLEPFLPDVVVLPRTTAEVSAVVRLAARADLPVVARGAGTGLSGGCLAEQGGIVLSLARMNRILEIDPRNRYAVVQPGLVNLWLSEATSAHGLYFAPDPASQQVSTVGGNVATNAGGPHCLKYGVTVQHVLGLTVVLADGGIVRIGGPEPDAPGYDLAGLLTGSEGTLAVVTEIVVRLLRKPEAVRTFLAIFDSVEAAGEAVSAIIAAGILPAALEMMDNLTVRAVEGFIRIGLPLDAGAILLVEVDGPEVAMARQVTRITGLCRAAGAKEVRTATDEAERKKIWQGRKSAFGAFGRLSTGFFVMDGVVPRSRLPETLREVYRIGEARGLRIGNVFHAGDGNLHPNILFDIGKPEEAKAAIEASKEILRLCVAMGGTLSGEHGIGYEKRELMPLLFGPDDLLTMTRVRDALDPDGRLNPGKIFPAGGEAAEPRPVAAAPGAWM
jgi:glycolate oxidase